MIFVSKTENYCYFKFLACTTICNTLIIVFHQAGGLLPTVGEGALFSRQGFQTLIDYLSQK